MNSLTPLIVVCYWSTCKRMKIHMIGQFGYQGNEAARASTTSRDHDNQSRAGDPGFVLASRGRGEWETPLTMPKQQPNLFPDPHSQNIQNREHSRVCSVWFGFKTESKMWFCFWSIPRTSSSENGFQLVLQFVLTIAKHSSLGGGCVFVQSLFLINFCVFIHCLLKTD